MYKESIIRVWEAAQDLILSLELVPPMVSSISEWVGNLDVGGDLEAAVHHALKGDDSLSMQLELHFACTDLKNMDVGSLTDSAVAVYMGAKYVPLAD